MSPIPIHIPHDFQIIAEEILENPCTEAALKSGVVESENTVRLHIVGETKGQVGSRVDEFAASRVYRIRRSVAQDGVRDQVGRDLVIRLSYIKSKAIKRERLFVVLVG